MKDFYFLGGLPRSGNTLLSAILIKNPEIQLNKIYDFLELNSYSHDFNNIEKLEKENLENAGLPSNLHDVRNKIEKTSPLPETILSPSSLNKYSGMEFWRKKNINKNTPKDKIQGGFFLYKTI